MMQHWKWEPCADAITTIPLYWKMRVNSEHSQAQSLGNVNMHQGRPASIS